MTGVIAMADPADRAAFQTLTSVKEEPSDAESEAGDTKVKIDRYLDHDQTLILFLNFLMMGSK